MHHDLDGVSVERSSRRTPMPLPGQARTAFIPLLEEAAAIPLEFIRFAVHLLGKHSVLRSRRWKAEFSAPNFTDAHSRYLEANMPLYHAYIVGSHSRFIGAVQMDCADDDTAIKSASRLVEKHDVELWHQDRPVVRFDAASKQMFKKQAEAPSPAVSQG
jgi:hypothetical protein